MNDACLHCLIVTDDLDGHFLIRLHISSFHDSTEHAPTQICQCLIPIIQLLANTHIYEKEKEKKRLTTNQGSIFSSNHYYLL